MGKAREIVPGVYQVSALGSRVTVLADGDQVVLLDAGLWMAAGILKRFLAEKSLGFHQVSHILVTHWHPDHIGALARLKETTGAVVGAHVLDAPYVSGERPYPSPFSGKVLGSILAPLAQLLRPRPVRIDLPLQDGYQLDVLGGLQTIHTPGHTLGSVSFYLPALGILHAGDALQRWGGRLGLPSRVFTADMALARASIQRMAALDVETLCLSHFPPVKNGARKELQELADRTS